MHVDTLQQAGKLLDGSALLLDEPLCVNLRGRALFCTDCADRCAQEALTLTQDTVTVDYARCSGCGSCTAACRVGVLRLSGFDVHRFLDRVGSLESIHVHCRESRDGGGGVVVPCLGVLSAALVAAGYARGVRDWQLHGLAHCPHCDRGDARDLVAEMQSRLHDWLEAPELVVVAADGNASSGQRDYQHQPALSRRGFLRMAGAGSALELAPWWLASDEETLTGEALPFYQGATSTQGIHPAWQALAASADRLPWRQAQDDDTTALPWSDETIAASCTACLTCAERCPTGALSGLQTREFRAISFDAGACVDCGLCERLCPQQAISRESKRAFAAFGTPQLLVKRPVQWCVQCRQPFVADRASNGLCMSCNNELQIEAEWDAMLSG